MTHKSIWNASLAIVFLSLFCAPPATALVTQFTDNESVPYPKEFMWGVAFSAHQAEGLTGGGEECDWYHFEHPTANRLGVVPKSPIANSDTADLAVDHWNRYAEDFKLAQELGVNTVRTSLAWEKIEPAPGVFNEEVLEHYRDVLIDMRDHGLRPMIALHHFTNPSWFVARGSWTNPESPKYFLAYAEKVVRSLGDLCDLWISFNEPMLYAYLGFFQGKIPPNQKSVKAAFEAAYNLARAHRMVASMVHQIQGASPDGRGRDGKLRGISTVNSFTLYQPANKLSRRDVEAVKDLNKLMNWDFLRAIESGEMNLRVPFLPLPESFHKKMPASDLPVDEKGPFFDWLGVNYYSRAKVHRSWNPLQPLQMLDTGDPKGDNGWAIYPQGLETVLRQTARQFHYPLVVSENGLADANDSKRPDFIRKSLKALDGALFGSTQGPALDVRGYYHWSLFDNFEWVEGYRYRFGLYEIKYDENLRRVPRGSAQVYSHEISRRQ